MIDLGEWQFVAFVNHCQMVEKNVFDFPSEINCNIMFLVERQGKIRLMSFKSNPWLMPDKDVQKKSDSFLYKDSIFLFSGILAGPSIGMAL